MKLFLWFIFTLSATSSAHTAITQLSPAHNAVVSAPKSVTLVFSESVDLHFCTFKVYPLAVTGNKLVLNRAAVSLRQTVLNDKNDTFKRADILIPVSRTAKTSEVNIPLKARLSPGNYVVMWRILSEDGHILTGQSVFRIQ